ncbi:acetylornithine transaminase [Bacillus marinisedimentorum]|uniref:acetylornithine transaminase n=1 Tax=Bacillus marinisedimentorum TaxID=1821260 RepID=UPI0008722E2D|nr:acetylornithine transaminase [Bacillus marinisedimentorum]
MDYLFPTYKRWDIEVVSAEGTKVTDKNGNEYLDFISGIGVCNLGHRHPAVQKALEDQLDRVWHVSNLFTIRQQEEAARLLSKAAGGGKVFFCNSGAEANEAAIKLARKYTGRKKIVTFLQSFHGRTIGAMSATGQAKIHEGFGPLVPEFVYSKFNDIEPLEKAVDSETAAVMLEVVQGEGGVIPAEKTFLQEAERLCRENGALLIIDEVQTGIGRTGKMFAFQHEGLSPDIITAAKGLGSGFPVGAVIGKEKLAESFGPGSHGTTFGGNPLAAAAARATLEVINQEAFLAETEEKGAYLQSSLERLAADNDRIKGIRGIGLMAGIVLDEEAAPIISDLQERGLLAVPAGPSVIRLLPPLTVSWEEIDQAVAALAEVITSEKLAAH